RGEQAEGRGLLREVDVGAAPRPLLQDRRGDLRAVSVTQLQIDVRLGLEALEESGDDRLRAPGVHDEGAVRASLFARRRVGLFVVRGAGGEEAEGQRESPATSGRAR